MSGPGLDVIGAAVRNRITALARRAAADGAVTTQIPALRDVDPRKFAVAVATSGGDTTSFGDAREPFSLQSISKVFALCALVSLDAGAWDRIRWGPSAHHHNSVAGLDHQPRPANPFVNAGAISVTDQLRARAGGAAAVGQGVLRSQTCPGGWPVDELVAASESATSHRDRAIAHLLADSGVLRGDPDAVLRDYFRRCATRGNVRDLALAALFLADGHDRFRVLPRRERRRVNSVLLTVLNRSIF